MSDEIIKTTKEETSVDVQTRTFMKEFGKYAAVGAGMAVLMNPTSSSANCYGGCRPPHGNNGGGKPHHGNNGGGKPHHGNNGFGNGDQSAPGGSGGHNNAENGSRGNPN